MKYLVISEVSKKQEYIFKSNRLSENVGASLIIKYVTEQLPEKIRKKYGGKMIFEGGGKGLYIFDDEKYAKEFIKEISTEVLREFPGIELFMTMDVIDMENENIAEKVDEKLYKKLAQKKNERKSSIRQLSFGIEKLCISTGTPASFLNSDGQAISREIKTKTNFQKNNDYQFLELIPKGYEFPRDLDNLFSNNSDKSYIAVIHIDGNKMGEKFANLKKLFNLDMEHNLENKNEEYIKALSSFSERVKKCYVEAFKAMCQSLVQELNYELIKNETNIENGIFPVRPIILAGDDITFVTNGKIGVECARIFLEKLTQNKVEIAKGEYVTLNGCAGIAIVKSHYPFVKAYELSEELCQTGKNLLSIRNKGDASLIDWHIVQGEIDENIYNLREKYYVLEHSKLTMKPIFLKNNEGWNNYDNFLQSIENIKKHKTGVNKIKTLREIFRKGPKASEKYIKVNNLENIIKALHGTKGDYGFNVDDNTCMYFDAIESMDLFINLRKEK